jgi:hypothetical protein
MEEGFKLPIPVNFRLGFPTFFSSQITHYTGMLVSRLL